MKKNKLGESPFCHWLWFFWHYWHSLWFLHFLLYICFVTDCKSPHIVLNILLLISYLMTCRRRYVPVLCIWEKKMNNKNIYQNLHERSTRWKDNLFGTCMFAKHLQDHKLKNVLRSLKRFCINRNLLFNV